MSEEISNIITEDLMWREHIAAEGQYEISKSGSTFIYEGQKWNYHASGLSRAVYRSDCGKFVIKIPVGDYCDEEDLKRFVKDGCRWAYPCIKHNIGEAQAYKECPEEYKTYLAKTELLPNCWVKQEFVKVLKIRMGMHDFRELGQREDGSFCIFDYDPLLTEFRFEGCDWKRLPDLIERASNSIRA